MKMWTYSQVLRVSVSEELWIEMVVVLIRTYLSSL